MFTGNKPKIFAPHPTIFFPMSEDFADHYAKYYAGQWPDNSAKAQRAQPKQNEHPENPMTGAEGQWQPHQEHAQQTRALVDRHSNYY